MVKVTVVISQAHHGYQQRGKFYQNYSIKINSISRQTYSGLSMGNNRSIFDHKFCFERSLNVTGICGKKCQLDATEVFIADLIACSTCFRHHYAHHQELKNIIQWLLPVVFRAVVFKLQDA